MPWTLYRYILRDLLKVMALSTTVLVVVIGFAAAIKPLSDGMLGPWSLLKFVLFLMPTMLGFALPFSAAFSSTLVLSRFSADNEVTACRASGLSYWSILLPVFAVGLVLTAGMFFLSNWVVPRFYYLADREIERDMMRLLVNQVGKRQPVKWGDLIIYADRADDSQKPPQVPEGAPAPYRMIVLEGAVVSRIDKKTGKVRQEGTAEAAYVYLYRIFNQTWATMQLRNVMVYNAERNETGWFGVWEPPGLEVPNLFRDKLQFLSWPDLKQLGQQPERFDRVRQRKRKLIESMANQVLIAESLRVLSAGRGDPKNRKAGLELTGPDGAVRYVVWAPKAERVGDAIRLSGVEGRPIHVEMVSNGLASRTVSAETGVIHVESGDPEPEPLFRVDLEKVEVFDVITNGKGAQRASMSLERSRWSREVMSPLGLTPVRDLIEQSKAMGAGDKAVRTASDALTEEIYRLGRRIVARLHERAASASSCMLVLMLGATMSLLLRGTTPLAVYFWVFLLATLSVMVARSGENVATDRSGEMAVGLLVIWSGNFILLASCGWVYFKLSRT